MDGWTDILMNEQTNGWMDGGMDSVFTPPVSLRWLVCGSGESIYGRRHADITPRRSEC